MEACRCLVNGLYQSQLVRSGFTIENCIYVTHLADRIFTTSLQIFNPTVQQPIFPEYLPEKLLELLYLDLRITFVITALDKQAKVSLSGILFNDGNLLFLMSLALPFFSSPSPNTLESLSGSYEHLSIEC